jgi:hypothetical protein
MRFWQQDQSRWRVFTFYKEIIIYNKDIIIYTGHYYVCTGYQVRGNRIRAVWRHECGGSTRGCCRVEAAPALAPCLLSLPSYVKLTPKLNTFTQVETAPALAPCLVRETKP